MYGPCKTWSIISLLDVATASSHEHVHSFGAGLWKKECIKHLNMFHYYLLSLSIVSHADAISVDVHT